MNEVKNYILSLLTEQYEFILAEEGLKLGEEIDTDSENQLRDDLPGELLGELELNNRAIALINNVIRTDESIDPEDPEKSKKFL